MQDSLFLSQTQLGNRTTTINNFFLTIKPSTTHFN